MRKITLVSSMMLYITCFNLACKKDGSNPSNITPTVTVTTVAGNGKIASTNGPALSASFNYPTAVAVDSQGNLYIADSGNNIIRKVSGSGIVSTFAGSGVAGAADGPGTLASFNEPTGIAVDANGNLYVADTYNNLIRKVSTAGNVSTFAGSGLQTSTNGLGTQASLNLPTAIAVDKEGNVYVCEPAGLLIRKIRPDGMVSTLAGTGLPGSANGPASSATFDRPVGIAADENGNIFVSEFPNGLIRKISSNGMVSTLAGSEKTGAENGTGTLATFNCPKGLAADAAGNVYVADYLNNLIRKITSDGVVTTFAGSGMIGSQDGSAMSASFDNPAGLAIDRAGNIYVADLANLLIRKITVH
jgi:sugar lactone lactonase YvrE